MRKKLEALGATRGDRQPGKKRPDIVNTMITKGSIRAYKITICFIVCPALGWGEADFQRDPSAPDALLDGRQRCWISHDETSFVQIWTLDRVPPRCQLRFSNGALKSGWDPI